MNILAFEMANVVFSVVAGLLLLVLGAYGRIERPPAAGQPLRPCRASAVDDGEPTSSRPRPEEFEAEAAMREAEIAVVEHCATADQQRRVAAMAAGAHPPGAPPSRGCSSTMLSRAAAGDVRSRAP